MKTVMRWVSLSLMAAAVLASCATAPATTSDTAVNTRGWELLGRRQVNFTLDRDAIAVTAARGTFKRLMFVVRDRGLEMYDVKVLFSNGDVFSPSTKLLFRQNSRSRIIDLPGRRRVVKRIDFAYRSLGAGIDRAEVEVWGK